MSDQSELDSKYFIDQYVFNCPFCNRRNVSYHLTSAREFEWTSDKKCYVYFAVCDSCQNTGMHLSFEKISIISVPHTSNEYRFSSDIDDQDIDAKFFYSVPTSFFALDTRIPRVLRELVTEAEGCLKSNFLTGASACARKVVYELARIEKAEGGNYDERIRSLKAKRPDIEPEYFDTLLTIQEVTSDKVHEESYDGWESRHLRLILSALTEVMTLMYVIPELRKEKRQAIVDLKNKIVGNSQGRRK